ncbi:MAG: T9SS type A sorting domain-containing protein [bacterium]
MKIKYLHYFLFIVLSLIIPLNAAGDAIISSDEEKVIPEALEVNIYPNPVSDQLSITFPEIPEKEISIKLVDITGRVAYTSTLRDKREFTIDLRDFSKGLYILNFFDEKGEVLKISKIQKI